MSLLQHHHNLSLAPTIKPLLKHFNGTIRSTFKAIQAAGFQAVQLDATVRGIRARDLDRLARKDLQSIIGRHSLQLAGIDLFIPYQHFTDPIHLDRAITATLATIELAADLGRVALSLPLPIQSIGEDVKKIIIESCDGHGVPIAIHAEDHLDELATWIKAVDLPLLGMGLDPAALLAYDQDPVQIAQQQAKHLRVGRLSDLQPDPTATGDANAHQRCMVGQGLLDLESYRIAMDLATRRNGPIVLDVRHLSNPLTACKHAQLAWDQATFSL